MNTSNNKKFLNNLRNFRTGQIKKKYVCSINPPTRGFANKEVILPLAIKSNNTLPVLQMLKGQRFIRYQPISDWHPYNRTAEIKMTLFLIS